MSATSDSLGSFRVFEGTPDGEMRQLQGEARLTAAECFEFTRGMESTATSQISVFKRVAGGWEEVTR